MFSTEVPLPRGLATDIFHLATRYVRVCVHTFLEVENELGKKRQERI